MDMLLDKRVSVFRPVKTADDFGSHTAINGMFLYNMACRIVDVRRDESRTFGRKSQVSSHVMFCNVISITENDIVKDGSLTYEVLDVQNQRNRFLRIRLGLVK